MPIKGITDKLRYQRAGKIYLGIKIKTDRLCKCTRDEKGRKKNPDKDCLLCLGTGYVYRPHETDYFVLKETQVPELLEIYSPQPKQLNVMLPRSWELEQIFPQNLKLYGTGGLKCWGNGAQASFINPEKKALDVKECPCEQLEKGRCSARAILNFRITELANSMLVYQITTGAYNSILNVNSALRDLMWFSLSNRVDISDIRLKLWRAPQQQQRLDDKSGKVARSTHYPMFLDLDPAYYESWNEVIKKALPIPKARQETPQLPAADVTEDGLAYIDAETQEEEIEEEEQKREESPIAPVKEAAAPKKKKAPEKKKEETSKPVAKANDEALKKAAEKEEEDLGEDAEQIMKDIAGDPQKEADVDSVFTEEQKKVDQRDELQKKLTSLIHQCSGIGLKLTKEEQEDLKLLRTTEDYTKMVTRFEGKLAMRRDRIQRFGHKFVMESEESKKEDAEE